MMGKLVQGFHTVDHFLLSSMTLPSFFQIDHIKVLDIIIFICYGEARLFQAQFYNLELGMEEMLQDYQLYLMILVCYL